MVDNSEKIQYPEYYSSNPTTSSGSHGSNSSSYQLAAEVPKKRTGRKVFKETRHPIYRGVRSRKGDKWVCELREPNTGTRIWLGTYTNPEMAARAHDVAALAFRGKSACLNFADSAWRLPVPASTDPSDVRRAAAEAAEMFNPGGETSSSSPATGKEDVDENGDDVYSYMEELDVVVEMPRLLSEMAEGMLLSSPTTSHVEDSSSSSNNESNIDWSQWNY